MGGTGPGVVKINKNTQANPPNQNGFVHRQIAYTPHWKPNTENLLGNNDNSNSTHTQAYL